ncbi:MAG: S-layer homology domain-containing protein [Ruminiclostridium sp.]|nr:S-layer homology domain-containing protein [Ruminiclostridium sp.]
MKSNLHRTLSLLLVLALALSFTLPALALDTSAPLTAILAEEEDPSEPGTNDPSEPGADDPSKPGTADPFEPGTDDPSEPGTDDPFEPGTDDPFEPGTDDPPGPSEDDPSQPSEDNPPVSDMLVLSFTGKDCQAGQFQTRTLKAPSVAVKNGDNDVTDNYVIGLSWLGDDNQTMAGQESAQFLPLELRTYRITCMVMAVNKTDPSKNLSTACVYHVEVLPSTSLEASLSVEHDPVTFDSLRDPVGNTVLYQLTKGLPESDFTPAVQGLSRVVFDLDSVTGDQVGKLNAKEGTSYVLSGEENLLSDLRFTPLQKGTYSICFTAYGEETYFGQLEIIVTPPEDPNKDIRNCDCSGFTFAGSDFFLSSDTDPVVSVVFGAPTAGNLLRNFVKGQGIPDVGARYYTNAAIYGEYHVSTLSYLPAAGYSGLAQIPVTLTTRSGGKTVKVINVNVLSKTSSDHFPDVTPETVGTWAANAVDFAYNYELVNGLPGGLFGPNESMTRAMLVTVLYRAAGAPQADITSNFTDLDASAYYYSAVVWAASKGIVKGTGDGSTFSPDDLVTRQQIATILFRYAQVMGGDTQILSDLNGYTDRNQVDSYAALPMAWAVGRGIITGTAPSTLSPQDNATRAQVVVILHRYLIGQ